MSKKEMNSRTQSKKQQSGVALIVVMLIVALITVLAVEMSARLQLNVARTLNIKANNQAYWYALGAEQFAQKSLSSLKALSADNINLSQPWAQTFEYPVEGGSIKAELSDMQACFNLNSISSKFQQEEKEEENSNDEEGSPAPVTPNTNSNSTTDNLSPAQRAFHRLLETYIPDSLVVDTIRDSLIDWIDEDSTPLNYGSEDADYESLPMPYLAANNPLSHPSELRLINGVEQAFQLASMRDLTNVLCVLPESNIKINVNTITEDNAVVLSALLGDTSSSIGADIISSRPEEGFAKKEDFLALPEVQTLELSPEQQQWFDVSSKYFKLNTTAKFQDSQFRLSTIFRLDDGGVTIISREFGGAL